MKVYFYSDFGYIVCAETTMGNTPMRVVINPVTVLKSNVTIAALGSAIFRSLEQSRNAQPVSRKEIDKYQLAEIFAELEAMGAENINLVNPTHY